VKSETKGVKFQNCSKHTNLVIAKRKALNNVLSDFLKIMSAHRKCIANNIVLAVTHLLVQFNNFDYELLFWNQKSFF